jgi:hypothetical protein
MRTTVFRFLALALAVLGAPPLVWRIWTNWPPGPLEFLLFAGELGVLWIFVSFAVTGKEK